MANCVGVRGEGGGYSMRFCGGTMSVACGSISSVENDSTLLVVHTFMH